MVPYPWETALGIPGLGEALLRDGEGFHQDSEIPEFGGHIGEEPFPLHEGLGHETMAFLDAAFDVGAGRAEILQIFPAGQAVLIAAGTAHGGNHQIPDLEVFYSRTHLDDFAHRFVPEHEIVGTGRRISVDEGADFAVRAADADIDGADSDLIISLKSGNRVFEDSNFSLTGSDAYCFHITFSRAR